ncbi:pectinesterase precursor [Colletotrichum truncatum]|uniref:Pectinesterase n=1 Tax=Colletotrichum truncatum TaxID=5467 RepID=A0ACC3Z0I3_COLTU|nr:pectinesterase precursor [Colletotrichum truncatum]KAF6800628.1 pectinesterase precursor [Colletotrichum truncatum]
MATTSKCSKGPNDDDLPKRPHLELFNYDPSESNQLSFHIFSQLPVELRLLVWNHALRCNRLLHVTVEEVGDRNLSCHTRYTLLNALGRPMTGNHYRVVIKPRGPFLSRLMRVNRESREATLAFYHVKLPCYLGSNPHSEKRTLSLNLDWDYLKIAAGPSWNNIFIDFIHDLRALDPQGRGLQHLVINDNFSASSTNNESHPRREDIMAFEPPGIDNTAMEAFAATVRNLKSIWFMCVHPGGRALDVLTYTHAHVFNYGFPIFPAFTFFDRPTRDPRNISRDLLKVWGGVHDPREKPFGWRSLLRNLTIDPDELDPSVDVRVMIGSNQEYNVRSRADAIGYLQEEDFEWLRLQWWFRGWEGEGWNGNRPAGCFGTASGLRPSLPSFDGPEVLSVAPRPALGFWLFPPEAFGEMREEESPGWLKIKGIFNLSSDWPDLALAHIN